MSESIKLHPAVTERLVNINTAINQLQAQVQSICEATIAAKNLLSEDPAENKYTLNQECTELVKTDQPILQ